MHHKGLWSFLGQLLGICVSPTARHTLPSPPRTPLPYQDRCYPTSEGLKAPASCLTLVLSPGHMSTVKQGLLGNAQDVDTAHLHILPQEERPQIITTYSLQQWTTVQVSKHPEFLQECPGGGMVC